jgi:hypothetical protein
MPKIDFCFSGWVRGAHVSKATTPEGVEIDVSGLTSAELVSRLSKGELAISLADHLYESDAEIEIFDYEGAD